MCTIKLQPNLAVIRWLSQGEFEVNFRRTLRFSFADMSSDRSRKKARKDNLSRPAFRVLCVENALQNRFDPFQKLRVGRILLKNLGQLFHRFHRAHRDQRTAKHCGSIQSFRRED